MTITNNQQLRDALTAIIEDPDRMYGPWKPSDALVNALIEAVKPPTDEEHEANAKAVVNELDTILVDALRVSPVEHPNIFAARDRLVSQLRYLFRDGDWKVREAERRRILARIAKEIS